MKDTLKKYIQDHREDFDMIEVPEDMLSRIMSDVNKKNIQKRRTLSVLSGKKWIAAASAAVLFCLGSYLFLNQKEPKKDLVLSGEINKKKVQNINNAPENFEVSIKPDPLTPANTEKIAISKNSIQTTSNKNKSQMLSDPITGNDFDKATAIALMDDPYSASSRLEGISLVKNFAASDEELIDILSEKAMSDENTNVRLAAVEVLSANIENPHITKNIESIFLNQNDAIIQKLLIAIIAQKSPSGFTLKMGSKLKQLASDPTTAAFVKDEAYAVLLKL